MIQFEYMLVKRYVYRDTNRGGDLSSEFDDLTWLNDLGKEGWELVYLDIPSDYMGNARFYLKRKIREKK